MASIAYGDPRIMILIFNGFVRYESKKDEFKLGNMVKRHLRGWGDL